MKRRDAAVLAFRNIARRPGRAVLTVLAVALAAALFTALLTITRTAQTRVLDQLSTGGPLAGIKVAAAAPDPGELGTDNPRPGAPKDLDDKAIADIKAINGVKSVSRVMTNNSVVIPPQQLINGQVTKVADEPRSFRNGARFQRVAGVDIEDSDHLPITLIAGRLPTAQSLTEAAVTPSFLESIDIARPDAASVVGSEIQIGSPRGIQNGSRTQLVGRWSRLLIVGVAAEDAAPAEVLTSIQQTQADRDWTTSGVSLGDDFKVPTSPYDGLFVVSKQLDQVDSVRNAITNIGYSSSAPENLIASVQRYLRVVEIVLGGIGIIALVISALGITNTLLAAVRERRREIGVLKAIGARDGDISTIFLVEAALLGGIGGVLGTAGGLALAQAVGVIVSQYLIAQGLEGVHAALPVELVIVAIVGSTLVSLLAGVLPAWRGARLPAREAVDA